MQKRRKTPLKKIVFETDSCSTDSRLKILHGLPFFKNLSHEEINEIIDYQKRSEREIRCSIRKKNLMHIPLGDGLSISILDRLH